MNNSMNTVTPFEFWDGKGRPLTRQEYVTRPGVVCRALAKWSLIATVGMARLEGKIKSLQLTEGK